MKDEAKKIIRHLACRLGREELYEFMRLFHGLRVTIPSISDYESLARELEVLEAFRNAPPGNLQAFYRNEARRHQCSPKTIERDLARRLKKAS